MRKHSQGLETAKGAWTAVNAAGHGKVRRTGGESK